MLELQRCDGERPICRRCRLQPPRSHTPCKYSHLPHGVLFSREEELGADRVLLRQPYSDYASLSSNIGKPYFLLEESFQVSNTVIGPEYSEGPTNTLTPGSIEVASRDMNATRYASADSTPSLIWATRVDVFLNRFAQHQFFFLDPAELKKAVLSPVPAALSHRDVLSSGLSNTVFLWTSSISQNFIADSGYSHEDLLSQTLSAIAGDAMSIDSRHRALQIMQAEVLLSLYYMETGRFLEGPLPLEFLRLSSSLPVGADNTRSAQSINAVWSIVILNNYWVAVSGVPSSVPSGTTINTAWPAVVSSAHDANHSSSMLNFLSQDHCVDGSTNDDDSDTSTLALLADASSLLARTIVFTALYQGIDPHSVEFWALDHRLESFRERLLLQVVGGAGSAPTVQLHLISHIFVYAAILQLHSAHSAASLVSHAKCLSATNGAATCLTDARLGDWEHADPILGPLLSAFAEFLIAQLSLSIQVGPPVVLGTILSALNTLAPRSALIGTPHFLVVRPGLDPYSLDRPEKCYVATQHRYAVAQMSMKFGVYAQHYIDP
ncbi:hypothetical protein GGX14DRAFT_609532 [Mycena pura]|uniref:Transcription factor domain-containing protein n=1 Tax=Mycena pura TaxID=153505 RepID=A0AAD6VL19_9AGAR|nr:hypothetical protein GGX14DRAFT_609532 [Mycena pura]